MFIHYKRLTNKNPTEVKFQSMENCIFSVVTSFSSDPKKLYHYLRDTKKIGSYSTFWGAKYEPLTDPSVIALSFNTFFHSTFTHSDFDLPRIEDLLTPSSQFTVELYFD